MLKRSLLIVLVITVCTFVFNGSSCADNGQRTDSIVSYQDYLMKQAQLPEIPHCPDINNSDEWDEATLARFDEWWDAKSEHQALQIPDAALLQDFVRSSTRSLLADQGTANFLYSPVSLWMCLHTLSDLTEGDSQAQILQVIGRQSDADRDKQLDAVFNALYWEEDASVCAPAMSVWLNKSTGISDSLMDRLAALHNSVFQGDMADEAYSTALRLWLNEQTRGLLKDSVSGLRFAPDAGLSVSSTLYLKSSWSTPFDVSKTANDVFYAPDGEHSTAFMHSSDEGVVFRGDGFTAVIVNFRDGGGVVFVLPDEGKDPAELLSEDGVYRFLFTEKEEADGLYGKVNLTVPKFDFLTAMPLRSTLEKMGITDIFDAGAACFSPELYIQARQSVSSLDQYARLKLDEEGVEAAAITITDVLTMLRPSENEIDFTLNRPFLYAVMADKNIPLFIGTYYTP